MAINLTEKYSDKVAERFAQNSITDAHAGKDYDFSGVNSIKIYSVDAVPIVDYTRSGTSRFGTLTELGDTIQEMAMSQDKGFTFSVDNGNSAEQMNIKQVTKRLKVNWDEQATPLIDKYRFNKWVYGAGGVATGTLDNTNIVQAIMVGTAYLSNKLVPLANRTIFIRESAYINCKLATEIVGVEKMANESLSKGVVGEIDGMQVVRVPDSYLPTGVNFLIKYKNSTVDPMKLKMMRVQKGPMGVDGDVGECRFMHDAFVLGTKVNGLYVNSVAAVTVSNPTIAISSNAATVSCSTSGATISYTTDGTSPKTSPTAATYSAAVTLTAGQTIRAYASKSGLLTSGITDAVNA